VAVRRRAIVLAAAVVAALTAAVTATELVARAREEAVAAQIDAIGPALSVVPTGTTASALARLAFSDATLPALTADTVVAALGSDVRAIEPRLVLTKRVTGLPTPVIGMDWTSVPARTAAGSRDVAALGSEFERRTGKLQKIDIEGRPFEVAAVMPSTGSAEDLAILLPLESAQALLGTRAVNELRVYLRAGVDPREAESRLTAALHDARAIRTDRGGVADHDTHASLVKHRAVAYAVMGIVAALCLVIAAHLDASERRIELATLAAIGASRATLLGLLLSRSALVAVAGATVGIVAGGALAAAQDPGVAGAMGRSGFFALACVAAALGIGLASAAPTALVWALRDPVPELQES
jgi:putative ABC transport system permease protein